MATNSTVALYLLRRLEELGVGHIYGVPGDYSLDFLDRVVASPIRFVGTCNELNAGYAADGYARVKGIGAACVTYGVGGYSILNATVGAFAEQVPLVIISGAPSTTLRRSHALVHHLTRDYNLQYDIFKRVTVDAALLLDARTAPQEIDRVLSNCITHKRPVYLEIPVDLVDAPCAELLDPLIPAPRSSDPDALAEAVEEAAELINTARDPVILVGVEVKRFGLADDVEALVEQIELPYATTISSKSVLPELHPQFIGVYQGGFSAEEVKQRVENSDCVLSLGVWMTDFVTGGFSAKIDGERLVSINSEHLQIRHHTYTNVWLGDFIAALLDELRPRPYAPKQPARYPPMRCTDFPVKGANLTAARFYTRVNAMLGDEMILLSDTGDAICATAGFYIQEADNFISQAYYLSIGYALPATLGAAQADPSKRTVLMIGDGAFQMTAQELSTIIRQNCNPVILLLNNKGYVIERLIHDGPYNDIQNWSYHTLPAVFGDAAAGVSVATEDEFEAVIMRVMTETDKPFLIEVQLDPTDCSELLAALGRKFRSMQTSTR